MNIKNSIFVRYYLLIVTVLFVFLLFGIFIYQDLIKNIFPKKKAMPALLIARVVDFINPENKVAAVKKMIAMKGNTLGPDLELLNGNGDILISENPKVEPVNKSELRLLKKPYDAIKLKQAEHSHLNWLFSTDFFSLYRDRPVFLVKLSGHPDYFLKIIPSDYADEGQKAAVFLFLAFILLAMSLLLGVAVSFLLIYFSMTRRIKSVDHVISELQKGNLKARFSISKTDELGLIMLRFNKMADEIEQLVLTVREADKKRIHLLQELTHDLKTPISSLKMLIETLDSDNPSLNNHLRTELFGMARKEIEYFARLVDDLLLLAKVSEPKHSIKRDLINLTELLNEKIDDLGCTETINHKKIIKQYPDQKIHIHGDIHLLQRALRNIFENALYFAKEHIFVNIVSLNNRTVKMTIQDDGPGFPAEVLQSFGERRTTRTMNMKDDKRVSLGLGSVIIKTICQLHEATLAVDNSVDHASQITGAKLTIEMQCAIP